MKTKTVAKMSVDVLMSVSLLFLMTYSLIGETLHEIIGVGMLFLFVAHHILNRHFVRNIFKGKYTAVRVIQTILAVLIFLTMTGSAVSGVMLSKHVFSFLNIGFGMETARKMHMVSAYGGFVLMSLHLGFH